jgi:hypothetical protein
MPANRFSPAGLIVLLVMAACAVLIVLDRANLAPQLRPLTTALFGWMVFLVAFALLLGVANVAFVHLRRVYTGGQDWLASSALLLTLVAVFLAGMLDPRGTTSPTVEWFFDAIIAPGQATLFALLAFFTAAAAFHYLRIGRRGGAWMLAGALAIFLAQLPGLDLPPTLAPAVDWLLNAPVTAIFRGALLGSGLALLLAGGRFLLGRPQGTK